MSDQDKNPEQEVKKKKTNERKVWHPQQEKILKEWAEISSSYRYLHDRAFAKFTSQNMWCSLPVILLSTITGTANFAQASMPPEARQYAPLVIGAANLIAGMITTVAQFLRVSELMEGHRVASIAFGRFSRNIAVELSLPTQERSESGTIFLNECRVEINKLLEQSPMVPIDIVKQFAKKFSHKIKCKKRVNVSNTHSQPQQVTTGHCCWKKTKTIDPSDAISDGSSDIVIDDTIECHCIKCTQFTKPEILEINPVDIYTPTREERVAETTARAAMKLKELMEKKEKEMRERDDIEDYKKEPTALDVINSLNNMKTFSYNSPETQKNSRTIGELVGRYKNAYNSEEFMARYRTSPTNRQDPPEDNQDPPEDNQDFNIDVNDNSGNVVNEDDELSEEDSNEN